MSKTRNNLLPQHHYDDGHYGELPLSSLPSGGASGDIFYYDGADWTVANLDTVVSGGVGSGSSTLTVREQDGSPSVTPVTTIKFSGSTVTDEGSGVVLIQTEASPLSVSAGDGLPVEEVIDIAFSGGHLDDGGSGTVVISYPLSGLTDVDLTTEAPEHLDFLRYDSGSSKWEPVAITPGSTAIAVQEPGQTAISDVSSIVVSGSTVTDDGGGQVSILTNAVRLLNDSGADRTQGSVVIIGSSSTSFLTTTVVSQSSHTVGVLMEDIASNSNGPVAIGGYIGHVEVADDPHIREYLYTSDTAGIASSSATRGAGAFGQILAITQQTVESGTDVTATFWDNPDFAGGSSTGWTGSTNFSVSSDPGNSCGSDHVAAVIGLGSQWIQYAFTGKTFIAGTPYTFSMCKSQVNASHTILAGDVSAGDTASVTATNLGTYSVTWTPSANRTSVTCRLTRNSTGSMNVKKGSLSTTGVAGARVTAILWDQPDPVGSEDPTGLTSVSDGTVTVSPATSATVPTGGVVDGGSGEAQLQFLTPTNGAQETVSTVAASGATETLDLADGNWHDVTLSDNCTFTFTGATNGVGCSFVLILRQDATGGRTVTWPASVEWPDDDEPTISTAANAVDVLTFLSRDGGTTWFGSTAGAGTGGLGDEFTVDAGTPTYDDADPAGVEVSISSKWGIDSNGDPYFNSVGVTSGEEAALMRNSEDGVYFLRSYTF